MTEEEILTSLREALDAESPAAGVSPDRVTQAEAALRVTFPPSYRLFLVHFGAGVAGDFPIAGLPDPPPDSGSSPLWDDVVIATTGLHRAGGGHIPRQYVFISSDGMDCKVYLDTSDPDASGECPVRVLGPRYGDAVVARSFVDFAVRAAACARDGREYLEEATSGRTEA